MGEDILKGDLCRSHFSWKIQAENEEASGGIRVESSEMPSTLAELIPWMFLGQCISFTSGRLLMYIKLRFVCAITETGIFSQNWMPSGLLLLSLVHSKGECWLKKLHLCNYRLNNLSDLMVAYSLPSIQLNNYEDIYVAVCIPETLLDSKKFRTVFLSHWLLHKGHRSRLQSFEKLWRKKICFGAMLPIKSGWTSPQELYVPRCDFPRNGKQWETVLL